MSAELVLLGEILSLARDPDVSLEEFGAKVATSPHLASEVVRVSNSALYGMEGRVHRLERAVLILGIRSVSSIASAILVGERLKAASIGGLSGDALWMHSLETGVCAQLLARSLDLPLEGEAYLAGLLHDLGILELHEEHGAPYGALVDRVREQALDLVAQERETFGVDHAQRLLERTRVWGFPDLLQQSVGHHHAPEHADPRARPIAALIHAAHVLIEIPVREWKDHVPSAVDGDALAALGLTTDDVADVLEELGERTKEIAAVFA
jgi:HD-like signal output (HDOD) protein